uniref:Thymus-specific serine protease n=1 Tax=Phaeomonas parva TaxID=124430 RepID=A0A7S1TSG3_9STRA|mmetsp:Transcript_14923/g.45022  ORF Transcript_14923/g.45022 Transcript_14923/m.45022 type:complete len:471 (+) Transcript_14923:255-1667(+)
MTSWWAASFTVSEAPLPRERLHSDEPGPTQHSHHHYHHPTGALMIKAAEKHGALILALEHRFYNPPDEYPVEDLSTENLRFLSSQQALADIANFHVHASAEFGLTSANRWVTWGGSYPGMMASWARYKYPHLIFAAVASSAPVQAVLNMQGYNNVVADAIANERIGGSKACRDTVVEIFEALGKAMISPDGRGKLYEEFNVCEKRKDPLKEPNNQDEFTMDLSFLVYDQGNDPSSTQPTSNLAVTCSEYILNVGLGDPVARLAALSRDSRGPLFPPTDDDGAADDECMSVSYEKNQVEAYQDVSLTGFSNTTVFCQRCWLFQTCTQFGFYQTCDPGTQCPYTSEPHLNTVETQLGLCESSFGIPPEAVRQHIETSLADYGGRYADTSRILYVNGGADPWRAQSVIEARPGLPTLEVADASHHPWTHPPQDSDQQSVKDARREIMYQVDEWLALSDDEAGAAAEMTYSAAA